MNRKLLSVILALVMVLGVFTPVFAEEAAPKAEEKKAEDVKAEEKVEEKPVEPEYIRLLKSERIIHGDKNGDLMQDKAINRAEFVAMLTRVDKQEDAAKAMESYFRFSDMDPAQKHWATGYAAYAEGRGWVKGFPNSQDVIQKTGKATSFMPALEISYQEIATMLVRYLGKEQPGFSFPASYLTEAINLGLFKDVKTDDYKAPAKRDDVFKMVYNAMSTTDFGSYNKYKVIVLENNRVAQLKETNDVKEVKAEVMSVLQIANNVDARSSKKVGEQFVLNLKDVIVEGGLADSENLLGKVLDITLNKDGKLVKAVVDKSYDYLHGAFSANEKELSIAGKKFSVRVDERYYKYGEIYARSDRDDRVYRTYLTEAGNNKYRYNYAKNFNYQEFAERLNLKENHKDKIDANFARVTVKDGMVIFVDAFNLNDIAPVQKVARDGSDIYYYNDAKNAAIDRLYIDADEDRIVGYNAKDGFFNMDKKDIKADDTIHWMNGFYLVRTDAKVNSKLLKTFYNAGGEWVEIERDEKKTSVHNLSSVKGGIKAPFNSVYAYDDKHYHVTDNRGQLKDMLDGNVKVLLDIRNRVQLITSDKGYSHRIGLVANTISAKGMKFFVSNLIKEGEKDIFVLNDGWNTFYYKQNVGGLNEQQYARFNGLDLAHTESDENGDAKVVAIIDNFNYDAKATHKIKDKWNKDKKEYEEQESYGEFFGYNDKDKKEVNPWLEASFPEKRRNIVKIGVHDYRYTNDTEVFVINRNKHGYRTDVIPNYDIDKVREYNEKNGALHAVVLTEKAYDKFLADRELVDYARYANTRETVAKVIIFTNVDGPQDKFENIEYGRLLQVNERAKEVIIELERGNDVTLKIHRDSTVKFKGDVKAGEFVQFQRVKGDPERALFTGVLRLEKDDPKEIEWTVAAEIDGRVRAAIVKKEVELRGSYIKVGGRKFEFDEVTRIFGNDRYANYVYVYAPSKDIADLIVFTEKPIAEANKSDKVEEAKKAAKEAKEKAEKALEKAIEKADEVLKAQKEANKLTDADAKKKALAKANIAVEEAKKALDEAIKEAKEAKVAEDKVKAAEDKKAELKTTRDEKEADKKAAVEKLEAYAKKIKALLKDGNTDPKAELADEKKLDDAKALLADVNNYASDVKDAGIVEDNDDAYKALKDDSTGLVKKLEEAIKAAENKIKDAADTKDLTEEMKKVTDVELVKDTDLTQDQASAVKTAVEKNVDTKKFTVTATKVTENNDDGSKYKIELKVTDNDTIKQDKEIKVTVATK